MRATREAHNPNLQVVIMNASHVCSQILQHSFGLAPRMNGIHRMQFDHARLELPSLVIWSCAFWLSVTWNLHTALHNLRLLLVIIIFATTIIIIFVIMHEKKFLKFWWSTGNFKGVVYKPKTKDKTAQNQTPNWCETKRGWLTHNTLLQANSHPKCLSSLNKSVLV